MATPDIVFYHYPFSPVARRVGWYLSLRNIPFTECIQPMILPRPDVIELLDVGYRRIPVLAIGKDIICDSRLQLKKLEEIYPSDRLGTSDAALAALLDQWSMETVFPAGSMCLPLDKGLGKDKAFVKDRSQFSGRSWDTEAVMKNRAEGLSIARGAFSFAENALLGHGGDWVLNGDKPTLADLNAVWVFDWLITMKPSALDNSNISKDTFPRVFAWCDRFREAHGKVKATKRVKGDEAKQLVVNGKSILHDIGIDTKDPLGLKAGDEVSITPVDSGRGNPTVGKVTGVSVDEIVIKVSTGLNVHFPRHGFKIKRGNSTAKL